MKLNQMALALIAAGFLTAGGVVAYKYEHTMIGEAHAETPTSQAAPAAGTASTMTLPNFASIVQEYGPAVVNISVEGMAKTGMANGASPFGDDPFFKFFRGLPMPMPRSEAPIHGQGSGFIVSSDGLILTNAHVVRGATEVNVKLTDRREFRAKVLGTDPRTDVAVLRIEAKGLPTVKLGDATTTKVGDWVLAIGSPFGFENSVTAGIVSAKGRSLPDGGAVPFIQTDVAVNPGNSGGPLFNLKGEVVGINSQIYSQTGGYQGLSFAIPIDVVSKVKDQIVATGHATHARLGVTVQEVSQGLAESFGLKQPTGALVSNVEPGSPASRAGIEAGDVILKFDGQTVGSSGDLPAVVGNSAPGQQAKLEVWRKGATRELTVTLGKTTDDESVAKADGNADASHGQLGLAVRALTAEERREAGVPNGVVVEDVTGPAAKAGIQPGDIVVALNGTRVNNVTELRQALAKSTKNVALLVQRGDARLFVPVHIG